MAWIGKQIKSDRQGIGPCLPPVVMEHQSWCHCRSGWFLGCVFIHSVVVIITLELLEQVQGLYLYRDVVRALSARWHHVFFAA